jgi:hypothetical protein
VGAKSIFSDSFTKKKAFIIGFGDLFSLLILIQAVRNGKRKKFFVKNAFKNIFPPFYDTFLVMAIAVATDNFLAFCFIFSMGFPSTTTFASFTWDLGNLFS